MVSVISTGKTIAKNTFSLLLSGVFCGIIQFFVIAYLARILGPDNFGKMNFAIAIVAYFTLIAHIGLPVLGTRDIARNRENPQQIIASITGLRLLLSIAGFIILLILAFLINEPIEIKYLILLYGLSVIPSALFVDWVYQGFEQMEFVSWGNVISTILYAGLVFLFITSPNQLLLIPVFHVTGLLASIMVLLVFLFKRVKNPFSSKIQVSYRQLLFDALPIGLSLICIQIFYNIDSVLLGIIKGTEEVGYYNAAYKIIMVLIIFIGYFHNSIFPVISEYYQSSRESLRKLLFISQKFMLILAFPIAAGGTILADRIIRLLYGSAYHDSVLPFQILLWAVFIIYINTGPSRVVLACNEERWYLLAMVIPAVVNIILNLIFIPRFGMTGAAGVTVISELCAITIIHYRFSEMVTIPFWSFFVKPFISTVVMCLCIFLGIYTLNLSLMSLIFSGAIVYFLTLLVIHGIDEDDITILKRITGHCN